ncbi:glycoside hydrolase family 3 N-terminal domain-containing protein [Zunongwangia endophytica]|uniref:beta-N-acetylhexosaminidase n=1 Tax=Zunongwangia endophytica TaxID=1808945 RepID=A0ABV8HCH9_9FLAO|nr:glycoside hydrolase family 3 N-terminal domain-containing protein [Zunongwangia endophytica]MDN3594004.1 glycoside hydrolase family 3 N-terminal domain-containing protein [Zunongwangia endophytica]
MRINARVTLFFLSFCFFNSILKAQLINTPDPLITKDSLAQEKWVDSIYSNYSLEQKLGQLFMVDIFSSGSERDFERVRSLIREQQIGGVIFSKGGPVREAKLTNEFQKLSKTPLLVGMDAEWGLAMRLDSTFALPWNMTLGAIQNNKLIEEAGAAISRHTKRLGIHINFAPVVDINTNPQNPIIGNRSFGENKFNVTQKALAFMHGMHKEGILSSAKHFPGHGDTDQDSHKTLPSISFPKERIEGVELYPYRSLIKDSLSSVMVAHLDVPALGTQEGRPTSLSKKVVTEMLRENLQFKGLIFTDALNMRGASNYDEPGEIDLAAFRAGNDILLISEDVPKSVEKLKSAYFSGLITEDRLAHSVKKILKAKYKAGLNDYKPVEEAFLYEELNGVRDQVLYENLMENAMTLIRNNKGMVPIKNLDEQKIAYVELGDDDGTVFLQQLKKYAKVDHISAEKLPQLLDKLKDYNYVIIGFHKSNDNPWKSYSFSNQELVWLHEIARENNTLLTVFASPYSILDIKSTTNIQSILEAYQNSEIAQKKAAQVIFGAIEAKGKLPVSIGIEFPEGTGYDTKSINRLSYGSPESVGMNSFKLKKIDSIVNYSIAQKMTPGAQVLVARKGKVIYSKNFGFHQYEHINPVTDTSVYDLASLTKILSTLPLVMKQVEDGIISFDTKLGEMMPVFQGTNKENIRLQDMLMHYAKLKAWIPFYVPTIDAVTKHPSTLYYNEAPNERFNTKVANDMYIRKDMQDTIIDIIAKSGLNRKKEYKYSDLPFYILKYYLEGFYGSNLNSITQNKLYKTLGANYTGYLPITRFPLDEIVPTENDKLWRGQLVHGYVHDQGAAMQGGIGGHAGLFSNANDVAKIMQTYMQGGSYGDQTYLKSKTIDKFNTCYYCNKNVRRGVGFDKPQISGGGPVCSCVSRSSFGHSGFTGTLAWADPEEEIVYIFLSNRVYPDSTNRKLIRENIRTKIQEVIYDAIDY